MHFPSSTWPGPHAQNRSKAARVGEQTVDIVSAHPLVTIHPETGEKKRYLLLKDGDLLSKSDGFNDENDGEGGPGEKVLNCSASFLKHIDGLSEEESADLLIQLWQHATEPQFTVAHAWSAGDVVLWDNRATMHLGQFSMEES